MSVNYNNMDRDACGIGMITNIDGHKDHRVLDDALTIVERLEHRAGKDASGEVGDGVGILAQISHSFFKKAMAEAGMPEMEEGDYGIGMCFLPQNNLTKTFAMRLLQVITEKAGLTFLGWRKVPTHPEILGQAAVECMPEIQQCFIARPEGCEKGFEFDRKLYTVRREFEQSNVDTYICSLSSRTIVYKGMFLVTQLREFYEDIQDPDYKSAIALVHSRFSTNTTPSWNRAHPYRMIAHNGEINTIRGNADRMLAREETMHLTTMEEDKDKIFPVITASGSDSAMLDNTLEFLYMNGMDLPLSMMITVPEPWKNNDAMSQKKREFYHYYATMMEPWDGPAALLFSDGDTVCASLDRNGLRPSRYYVTDDGRVILSSEVGVLEIPAEHIVKKSRLEPGKLLVIDTKKQKIISDEECKKYYAARKPYGEWLALNLLHLEDLRIPNKKVPYHSQEKRDKLLKVFGYSYEDVMENVIPMAENGVEPTVSMGHDVPLAVVSKKHQSLYNYFKQLFAQVTNPPIDSLREKVVVDTTVYIGSDGDLLNEKSENCRVLEVNNPVLSGTDLMKIRVLDEPGFRSETISILYYKHTPLKHAVDQLCLAVDRAAANGKNIIILSDRGVDENHAPIPSLLAVSAVEQHLIRTKKRTKVSLVLESGEVRDVHQVAVLLGFGARAINPYLAHECISEMIDRKVLDKDYHTAIDDYNRALLNGVTKIAAKMGISTLQSYQSARIFEAVGLSQELVDSYFAGIVSKVGGIGIEEIGEDVLWHHDHAFDPLGLSVNPSIDSVGFHKLRSGEDKEEHLYRPETIIALQQAVRTGDYNRFKEYTAMLDNDKDLYNLRNLLELVPEKEPVPLEEVEPVESIVKRFKTGAMSYGSLSQEAHETLAIAMNRIGGKSNTGEGGERPERFGTEKNSAIKQVASGRFGVTSEYLCSAKEIQIKMAQGAKPGEGGHLPGKKVYPHVAKIRFSTPGVALISPPPHHDIYSIEDLAQLIYDLKNANRQARISVKLVSESGVGTIASGVAKAGAQVILVSGYDGGTGAAPFSSVHHAGLPWELGLAEAHQTLVENGLRDRVVLETDGKLMTGLDVVKAALFGAEEYAFATAPLVCVGCMMMRVCSKDTCPVGVATQNPELRKHFAGKPEHVINFMYFIAQEMREYMAKLGFRTVEEMVGRTDCLKKREDLPIDRAKLIDFDRILKAPVEDMPRHFVPEHVYDFQLEKTKDEAVLLPAFEKSLQGSKEYARGQIELKVTNTDRSFGTIFGSEITRHFGNDLAEDSYVISCHGSGGQSFGAFIPKGLTLKLYGDANDGFGKGLSGGKLIIRPEENAAYKASENTIIGNVALYGATRGKIYVSGKAGERFCVRNSGALAVVEGVGDHGLEYMTGGMAVILGPTGKNFAAGMSGGTAYVLDEDHTLYQRMNKDMAMLEELTEKYDIEELRRILQDFVKETDSARGKEILEDFDSYIPSFKKIVPMDYQNMLSLISKYEEQGIPHEDALIEAFNEVARS
jgi:glutamate synthase (NADPH) large chain